MLHVSSMFCPCIVVAFLVLVGSPCIPRCYLLSVKQNGCLRAKPSSRAVMPLSQAVMPSSQAPPMHHCQSPVPTRKATTTSSLLPSSLLLSVVVVLIVEITPPSLLGMHPTTSWVLCQKMRSSLSLPLGSSSPSLSTTSSLSLSTLLLSVVVVVIIKITPPPCQECIPPQVGCCVKK